MCFDFIENGYHYARIYASSKDDFKDLRTFRVTNVLWTIKPYKYALIRNFQITFLKNEFCLKLIEPKAIPLNIFFFLNCCKRVPQSWSSFALYAETGSIGWLTKIHKGITTQDLQSWGCFPCSTAASWPPEFLALIWTISQASCIWDTGTEEAEAGYWRSAGAAQWIPSHTGELLSHYEYIMNMNM